MNIHRRTVLRVIERKRDVIVVIQIERQIKSALPNLSICVSHVWIVRSNYGKTKQKPVLIFHNLYKERLWNSERSLHGNPWVETRIDTSEREEKINNLL